MKDKEKQIFTIKVTYKADITVVVEADSADDALRIATQKAETADNSEFNIYDEQDICVVDFWSPREHEERAEPLPAAQGPGVPEPIMDIVERIDQEGPEPI